jgi:glycosyltransferase involved in cell wall biosynthesis
MPIANAGSTLRLVCVVHGFALGGAETMLLGFVRWLTARGHHVVVANTGPSGPLAASYHTAAARTVTLHRTRTADLHLVRQLRRVIEEESPDAVLSVLFYADVVTALAVRGTAVPHISWQHVPPSQDVKNRRFYHRAAYRFLLPRCCAVICCAEHVRREIVHTFHVREERTCTVHNGVDLARFMFHPPRAPNGEFRIGMVARFGPEKGHDTLVHALPPVLNDVPGARLVLVGDGVTRPRVQQLAQALGVADRVEFTGAIQEAERVYPRLDAVALPSECEALPVSVLEAMASGRPVVASDIPGVREAIVEGETGFLFPVGDSRTLAQRIIQLARDRDERGRMGRAGRTRVERAFDQETQLRALYGALTRAIGRAC